MILIHGKLLPNEAQLQIIDHLAIDIAHTLQNDEGIDAHMVISACDILLQKVLNHQFDSILMPLLQNLDISYDMFLKHASLFSRKSLVHKVEVELGSVDSQDRMLDEHNRATRYPLGVLLHIAAGNVDGLPAYSVIEGLLTGNINLLKLPSGDQGLSILLLQELIQIEPRLQDYIYVFDVPSTEIESIKKLASHSDAVIVWGGDAAVKAARDFADVQTKIIAWGHKLSFAYCDLSVDDRSLISLSESICKTNQLLCSSVQGIYLNTTSREEQLAFAKRFFDVFVSVSKKTKMTPIGMRGKNAISLYNEVLERGNDIGVFSDAGVSVVTYDDQALTLSYLYRNIWIKRLPIHDIIRVLKPYKNYLQSAGVYVDKDHEEQVCTYLAKSGVVRITHLGETSRMISGEAHDGEYPLRLYSRIVERHI